MFDAVLRLQANDTVLPMTYVMRGERVEGSAPARVFCPGTASFFGVSLRDTLESVSFVDPGALRTRAAVLRYFGKSIWRTRATAKS